MFVKNPYSYFVFPLLKVLHLNHVTFSEHRCLLELFNGCPILEDLEVSYIEFENSSTFECEYKSLPKLVRARISAVFKPDIPLIVFSKAEFLRLEQGDDTDVPMFSNLTHLELFLAMRTPWSFVFDMLKNCPNLQSLAVDNVAGQILRYLDDLLWDRHDDEVFCYPDSVPYCLSSQFRNCTLTWYYGEKNEKKFVEYILQNASSLQTMSVVGISSLDPMELHHLLHQLSLYPKSSATCVVSFKLDG